MDTGCDRCGCCATGTEEYGIIYDVVNMNREMLMGCAARMPRVRYSVAYPTDAPEKLCFGGKPHEVRPMVWLDRRSLRGAKSIEACPQGAARERIAKGLLYHGVPIVFDPIVFHVAK